ncbi:MAG: decaprenyl-phosphate phosphoribosyltransferase [Phycisphaerae bacterium]|nr:decaprenyl-phosphate phosphoribosyltransferase [Phycisphaerae bacterium]MDP7636797.1 decaprenyl-phosphate phosphoribosyltransferase [Phycisphaerae bacterium]
MAFLKHAIRLARPEHWIKNIIVLFPVVFARREDDPQAWSSAALASVAFCLASSASYIFNDIFDRDKDRLHPRKSGRPLAAGQISLLAAAAEAALLFVAAVAVAWTVNQIVLGIIVAYLLMQLVYTLWLKQKMLVDVICIAMGFVLRAAAGAVAIPVEVSPWLFVCTFTICLFMGFCKRCNELATLAVREEARQHRRTLGGYSPELLTHLITLSAGVAIVAFLLYASSNRTVNNLGTNYLIYTLPAVVYGISRFAMLSMKGVYSDPTALILRDRPFQYTMAIWFATVIAIIFWGHDVERWLRSLI